MAWASLTAAVLLTLGWLMYRMPAHAQERPYWWMPALAGGVVLLGVLLAWRSGRAGSAATVHRWLRRSRRNEGVASRWAIWRTSSRRAMRRKATVLRPSLAEVSWWQRLRTPTTEFATRLARVGVQWVRTAIEEVTVRLGGPRTGKSGELACRILDAPGAVIATSTRTDLIDLTSALRAEVGRVMVFNPSGVGGLDSTVMFDPLAGCAHPPVAADRAADLLAGMSAPGGADSGDREFWITQARRVLAALLHAAALNEGSMRDVLAWVSDPERGQQEIQSALRRSPEPAYVADALQFLTTNDRTQSSICATIMPALGWMTNRQASAAAGVDLPAGQVPAFDVEALLEQRGTVYMLGAEEAQVAPLVTALTGFIAREARRVAGTRAKGRLDPPLTLVLDEAALICPIPLDSWTADMGGRGVTIHIAAQSRAQLRARWGPEGAAAIMNNAAALLIYGGTRDADDLAAYATLTGEREEEVPTFGRDGHVTTTTTRLVPVLSAAQIAGLPAGRVLIIRRGMAAAVGRVQMAWQRRDVRAVKRAERRDQAARRRSERAQRAALWLGGRIESTSNGWRSLRARMAQRKTSPPAASASPVNEEGS